jgi:hypothetical protein
MSADSVDFWYSASAIIVAGLTVVLLWRRHENFRSDAIFTGPETLSVGQLGNLVRYARLVMKNNAIGSEKHEDAARRLTAAQAEQVRRYKALGLDRNG